MWLEAGALLKDRIEAIKPAGSIVLIVDEMTDADDKNNYPFCYFIVYGGYSSPSETIGYGPVVVKQTWHIIVTARESTLGRQGGSRLAAVDNMCDVLLSGLIGHRLADNYDNLEITSPPSFNTDAGIIYIPFTFQVNKILTGECL